MAIKRPLLLSVAFCLGGVFGEIFEEDV